MNRNRRRAGVSALELLIVAGIVTAVAALALSGVQAARESSRRITCQANLKSIGVALQAYHAAFGEFPSLAYAEKGFRDAEGNAHTTTRRYISPFAHLLPHLGFETVAEAADLSVSEVDAFTSTNGPNATAKSTIIGLFLCPSDASSFPFKGNVSYRCNVGAGSFAHSTHPTERKSIGAFFIMRSHRLRDFADGSSKTASVAERRLGDNDDQRFQFGADFWYTGYYDMPNSKPTADQTLALCASQRTIGDHYSFSGYSWFNGGFENTWYNHVAAPNAAVADCSLDGGITPWPPTQGGSFAARSRHAGIVNVLLADGSVRSAGDAIDLAIWRATATLAGGDDLATAL